MKYQIYCDMDSVLTDFPNLFKTKFKRTIEEIKSKYGDGFVWALINKVGEPFWADMPWMVDGKQLWEYIKSYNPIILSAPARSANCVSGKIKWIKRELDLNQPHIIDAKKYKYAKPNHILIDDSKKNIDKWIEAGGIGILHKNTQDTIKQLQKYGIGKLNNFKEYFDKEA